MEYPFYPVFPSLNGQGHLATLALNKPFRPSRGGLIIARINTFRYCGVKLRSQLPRRVLELSRTTVRLREKPDEKDIYACLSHCWGPTRLSFALTKNTIEPLKAGISIAELPRTFREAIELCLRLDIRYLWIDALCK
jgi:hypothetical protein